MALALRKGLVALAAISAAIAVVCIVSFLVGLTLGPLRGARLFDVATWSGVLALCAGMWSRRSARAGRGSQVSSPDSQRPTEIGLDSPPRRLASTLLGTVIGVLLVNFAAMFYLDRYLHDASRRTVSQKWELLGSMDTPVEWLVLGDSSGNQGVIPQVLSAALGGASVNLCTIGPATTVHQAMMLEAYIAKFGPPKNLILVNSFVITAEVFNPVVLAKAPVPWGLSPMLRFSPDTISVKDQLRVALARYVPLYYENRELKTLIRRAFKAPSSILALPHRVALTTDGYMPMYDTVFSERMLLEIEEELERQGIRFTDGSLRGIERMVALVEQYGIRTFVFTGPMYDGLKQSAAFGRNFAPVQRWWNERAARTRQVTHVDRLYTFPMEQMGDDAQHVVHVAAEIYTRQIASDIRQIEQVGRSTQSARQR
jgi:hypothetical protein